MRKMQWMVLVLVMVSVSSIPSWGQTASSELGGYYQAVSSHFRVDLAQVKDVASYLPRAEELPVLYMVALKTGSDPLAMAQERYQGTKWSSILKAQGLGSDLFKVDIKGFVPSHTFQSILDKFPQDQVQTGQIATLTDRDVLNLANLIFISDYYGYSKYRVIASRDKGQSYMRIQSGIAQTHNTATASMGGTIAGQ